jgi:hypothetical protein
MTGRPDRIDTLIFFIRDTMLCDNAELAHGTNSYTNRYEFIKERFYKKISAGTVVMLYIHQWSHIFNCICTNGTLKGAYQIDVHICVPSSHVANRIQY